MRNTILAIIVATILIVFALVLTNNDKKDKKENTNTPTEVAYLNNISIVDGKQIIEIRAKGGYLPRKSIAKAGIPTILRMNTKGTFDCSSFVRIPSMNITKTLPQSGITDIDLGINEIGILHGTCSMGMYPFEIHFE